MSNRALLAAACACSSLLQSNACLAAGDAIDARELVELRDLSGLAVSPDGACVAVRLEQQIVETNRTRLTWYVVPVRGAPTRLADAGEPMWTPNGQLVTERPQWSADSRWIYYRALADGAVQVWRAARDGSRAEQLTNDPADVESFLIDSNAGVLRYTVRATRQAIQEAEEAEYVSGILLDESVAPGFAVHRGFLINGRRATYRHSEGNDNGGQMQTLLGASPPRTYALDLSARAKTAVHSDASATAATAAAANEQATAYLLPKSELPATAAEGFRARRVLQWRDAAQGVALTCRHKVCLQSDEISILGLLGKPRQSVVFKAANFATRGIYVWDPVRDRVRTLVEDESAYGVNRNGSAPCELSPKEALCIVSAADVPPRLAAIDLQTGQRRILFDPNPQLSADRLGKAQTIVLHDRFGGSAYAWLVLPRNRRGSERLPLVIISYVCEGFLRGGSGSDVPEHVLAGQGFAALCVEASRRHRPGENVPQSFLESVEYAPTVTLDIFENAIEELDRRGIVDRNRVAVSGLSYGASATTYAISHSKRFQAAIVTSTGYLDPLISYLYGATDLYRRNARSGVKPYPYNDPQRVWERFSPALNAQQIDAPLLMQLAEAEYVPMMQLFSVMKDYGKSVEMTIFSDEFHIKHQPKHRLAVYERNTGWLGFWLKGAEDEAGGKAAQYARWRAMRDNQCRRLGGADAPWYCNSSTGGFAAPKEVAIP